MDVIVVGGGVAGLTAALFLGRCLRRVLVCDSNRPRNAVSPAIHGLIGRDGVAPDALRRAARRELRRYETVEFRDAEVRDCAPARSGFEVTLADGSTASARKLLLATGVVDELPPVEGAREWFGRGVFHCPYCDGWELRGRPLGVYGAGKAGLDLALELTAWSDEIVLLASGPARLSAAQRGRLARHGVRVDKRDIARLEGDGRLEQVRFGDGAAVPCAGLFFVPSWRQRADLAERLGCALDENGLVVAGRDCATQVPGVYAAGDTSGGLQLAAVAASEGARAAVAINAKLVKEDLAARDRKPSASRARAPAAREAGH